jgi:hypothetical protein
MCGGHSFLSLDGTFPPPVEDMSKDTWEKSNDDATMRCPNPRSVPTKNAGFQMCEWKLHKENIR